MFREFFDNFNSNALADTSPEPRKPIHAEVIEVPENATNLDPVTEVAEIQRMINIHNEAIDNRTLPANARPFEIARSILFTGYLVSQADAERLLAAANFPTSKASDDDIRVLANSIMISPRPPTKFVLDKIGGLGKKMKWRIVATGSWSNKVWAARVEPVDPTERYHCASQIPLITLACRGSGRPADSNNIKSWQPLPQDRQFEFETVVGEKVQLRIEEVQRRDSDFGERGSKRTQTFDEEEDFPALGTSQPIKQHLPNKPAAKPGQQTRNYSTNENHQSNGPPSAYARAGGGRQHSGRGSHQNYSRGGGSGGGGQGRGGGSTGMNSSSASGGRSGSQRGGMAWRGRGRGGHSGAYRSLDDQSRRGNPPGPQNDSGLTY